MKIVIFSKQSKLLSLIKTVLCSIKQFTHGASAQEGTLCVQQGATVHKKTKGYFQRLKNTKLNNSNFVEAMPQVGPSVIQLTSCSPTSVYWQDEDPKRAF